MIKQTSRYLLLLLITLASCQQASPTPTPTPLPPLPETAVPETAVPETAPTDSLPDPTNPPPPTDTPTVESNLPAPTLFATDWLDREPFRAGLVSSQQAILDQLPHAPIYHMELNVIENETVVVGRMEVYYTNQESSPLDTIYFHLYPNLLGGQIEISNTTINSTMVTPLFESFNDSILRLDLPETLALEETAVVSLDFTTYVPTESGRNYGIFATVRDVMALAHFYPQLVVNDEDGWNLQVPSDQGDVTYADTSFYLVRATLPSAQVMAASGIEIEHSDDGTTQTSTHAAGPMRDFYMASSANYNRNSQTVGEITINNYAPAAFDEGALTAIDFATDAVNSFSERFVPYPFTELDMVATPTLALGVEYPGIVANRDTLYDLETNNFGVPTIDVLESTTVHEVGHQWFYSLIGNDQLNEPWLDESVTQYITWLYYIDRYGENDARGFYNTLDLRWSRVSYDTVPIGQPVSDYSGAEYGAIVYGRGPIFVATLAETMGEEPFADFLQAYAQANQWGIGTTAEFKEMAESHCNCDLTTIFNEWVFES